MSARYTALRFRGPRLVALCAAFVLFGGRVRAGDKEAHTNAIYQADALVSARPEFSKGVGAPLVNHRVVDAIALSLPAFTIPGPRPLCGGYEKDLPFDGDGCAYQSPEGVDINEPDNWQCFDPRAPPAIVDAAYTLEPGQSTVASLLGEIGIASEANAMACNWTHFAQNPALSGATNEKVPLDAASAYEATSAWAEEIPTAIEQSSVARTRFRCDDATWDEYMRRVYNALHFQQDAQCEHHLKGNLLCGVESWIPKTASPEKAILDFGNLKTCSDWLVDTLTKVQGPFPPPFRCDEELLSARDEGDTSVSLNLRTSALAHTFPALGPLARMGLERLLRHHCKLEDSKTLTCDGPAGNHGDAASASYCEGETYTGGGQDFLTLATNASTDPITKAAERWATVCKEPDDPCDPAQCDIWCRRSTSAVKVAGSAVQITTRGYCVNSESDPLCVLHECLCQDETDCGARTQQCCLVGTPCVDPADSCDPATGTCGAPSQSRCAAPPALATDASFEASGVVANGQRDSYKVTVQAGQSILIRLADDDGGPFVPAFRLYDPSGAPLIRGNILDPTASWAADVARFAIRATTTGTYGIDVYDESGISVVKGSYTLYVVVAPGADKGGALVNDGVTSGMLRKGALDSYTFEAQKGDSIILRATDVDMGPLVIALAVYDPAGAPLTAVYPADPVGIWGADVVSFPFAAETNGTYTVVVYDDSGNYGATGNYNLRFERVPGADKYGSLKSGEAVSGNLAEGALDSYTFDAQEGDGIMLRATDVAGGALVVAMAVYDPSGVALAKKTPDPIGTWGSDVAFVPFRAAATGTYTVVVYDDSNGRATTGPYNLFFTRAPGANKYGALAPGGVASGTLAEGALDSYTFDAQRGDAIILRATDVAGGPLVVAMAVYDPNGVALAAKTPDPIGTWGSDVAFFPFRATTSGTFTVVVYDDSNGWAATGPYKLYFVKAPGANEYGALTPGTDASGTLAEGALDSYTFAAQEGARITLRATDVSGGPLVIAMAVYDPSGVALTRTTPDPIGTWGYDAASFTFTVSMTGTFTVVIYDDSNGWSSSGPYTLALTAN